MYRDLARQSPDDNSEPDGWWGFGWEVPDPLTVVDLITAGNFDAQTAALLWLLIEARASIIVAADPPGAGKTTTLTALSDFLPPATERIYLRGWNETFDWLGTADPAGSYILCNEISSHLPVYLWGRKVEQLFATVETGFGFGATMHADTSQEVVAILEGYPLYLPRRAVARLDLILTLAVEYHARRPRRRLDALTLLRRDGTGDDYDPEVLAHWDHAREAVAHLPGPPPPALTLRPVHIPASFTEEQSRRAAFLADLVAHGIRARADVRQALAAYQATGSE
jgi:hypothetical protein